MPPPTGMSSTCTRPAPHLEDTARPIAGPFFCALTSSSSAQSRAVALELDHTARPGTRHRADGSRYRPAGSWASSAWPGPRSVVRRRRYPRCSAVPRETHIGAYRGLEALARAALAPCARRMRHGPAGGPDCPILSWVPGISGQIALIDRSWRRAQIDGPRPGDRGQGPCFARTITRNLI